MVDVQWERNRWERNTNADIDTISKRLGIQWEVSKSVPFGTEVPYLGFCWNLCTCIVYLLEEKKEKYLAAIAEWESKCMHNLLETQKLYGKLLHALLVMPAGCAHLTNLEAMLGSFHNRIFLLHTPPCDMLDDLGWWRQQLSQPEIARPIPEPQPLIDYDAYSNASSGFGVAITIGLKWRTWLLAAGWKSQGRDIQWAEAISFELLVVCLCALSGEGEHIKVYGDNRGVVEGWWKGSSTNKPTNHVFRRILWISESRNRTIHTRYVPSAQNPADTPSRGRYPPLELLLDHIAIPEEIQHFLIDV